jgi:hypothetical protein
MLVEPTAGSSHRRPPSSYPPDRQDPAEDGVNREPCLAAPPAPASLAEARAPGRSSPAWAETLQADLSLGYWR